MSENTHIMLPRIGHHLSVWGRGHSCSSDDPHETCMCECGVPAPQEVPGIEIIDGWEYRGYSQ